MFADRRALDQVEPWDQGAAAPKGEPARDQALPVRAHRRAAAILMLLTAVSTMSSAVIADDANLSPSASAPPWQPHDRTRPQPRPVTPGSGTVGATPPSDATVLFDGQDMAAWKGEDRGQWKVEDGALLTGGARYNLLRTRASFGDIQVHLEFQEPNPPSGDDQHRGNSGIFLMSLYEVQIMDPVDNPTSADGTLGALYGQQPPRVQAARPPGQWQSFDIIFEAPRFDDGRLVSPAYVTVLLNGVLLHHRQPFLGETASVSKTPGYAATLSTGPLALQDHGTPGQVRFRNIWVRPLGGYDEP